MEAMNGRPYNKKSKTASVDNCKPDDKGLCIKYKVEFLWSHTVITENAKRQIFNVQNLESILPNVLTLLHLEEQYIENLMSKMDKL